MADMGLHVNGCTIFKMASHWVRGSIAGQACWLKTINRDCARHFNDEKQRCSRVQNFSASERGSSSILNLYLIS